MNVGKDTTSGNGDIAQQLVELFVVLDGKSNVTRHNTTLLVITSGIASKLKNLSTEILEDSGKVDGSAGTHACAVLSLTQVTTDTTDRELQASLGRCRGRLFLTASTLSFSFSRHDDSNFGRLASVQTTTTSSSQLLSKASVNR
jgi:hypothetical protein